MRAGHLERSHESTVVAAGRMLVMNDKLKCIALGQSTDSRCRMESPYEVAQMVVVGQGEGED